jgi:hypothetical protein
MHKDLLHNFVVVKLASNPPPPKKKKPTPVNHSPFVASYLSSLCVEAAPMFAIRNYVCEKGVGGV